MDECKRYSTEQPIDMRVERKISLQQMLDCCTQGRKNTYYGYFNTDTYKTTYTKGNYLIADHTQYNKPFYIVMFTTRDVQGYGHMLTRIFLNYHMLNTYTLRILYEDAQI